ncbi:MAG: c-type cytochrome [Rhodothermales bacterium]|nr:c-type cytochrome [Rhodothermales bacterium]
MRLHFIPFVLAVLILSACDTAVTEVSPEPDPTEDPAITARLDLPTEPFDYASNMVPAFARQDADGEDNTPASNRVTDWGATLGRVLFYDTALSANRTVSCASCHQQEHGFADPVPLSIGFDGDQTGRNAMSVANIRFYRNGNMFWDERAMSVEEQALLPIQDAAEMGLTLDELVTRINAADYYDDLFERAFGSSEVSTQRIANAIAQFERSMVTFNSRFDQARAGAPARPGQDLPGLTAEENEGLRLFFSGRTQCANCHRGVLAVGDQARNNGLDLDTRADQGAGQGRFKTASLRNIELTGPYMHDGRFATLREVIEFYNTGIQDHPNLDNRLQQNGRPRRMNLSNQEVDALVAFLETMTDPTLATDERFSDPFVRD